MSRSEFLRASVRRDTRAPPPLAAPARSHTAVSTFVEAIEAKYHSDMALDAADIGLALANIAEKAALRQPAGGVEDPVTGHIDDPDAAEHALIASALYLNVSDDTDTFKTIQRRAVARYLLGYLRDAAFDDALPAGVTTAMRARCAARTGLAYVKVGGAAAWSGRSFSRATVIMGAARVAGAPMPRAAASFVAGCATALEALEARARRRRGIANMFDDLLTLAYAIVREAYCTLDCGAGLERNMRAMRTVLSTLDGYNPPSAMERERTPTVVPTIADAAPLSPRAALREMLDARVPAPAPPPRAALPTCDE